MEEPSMGLPLPYVAQKKMRSLLGLVPFSKCPTRNEWNAYRGWVAKQAKKIDNGNFENLTLGVVEGNILTESCLYSVTPKIGHTDCVTRECIKYISRQCVLNDSVVFVALILYHIIVRE